MRVRSEDGAHRRGLAVCGKRTSRSRGAPSLRLVYSGPHGRGAPSLRLGVYILGNDRVFTQHSRVGFEILFVPPTMET